MDDTHERHRRENRLLRRLGLVNSLNGLGIGMVAPLMAYWYAVRYGHGPDSIGPAMAATFVLVVLTDLNDLRPRIRKGGDAREGTAPQKPEAGE